jgi:hypothetical protein
MRFMMIMIPGEHPDVRPDGDEVGPMSKYNDEMTKAGVMLAGVGLHPASKGARVTYSGGTPTVTDGPFAEAKELIGGYWILETSSKEEAVEWAKRVPAGEQDMVELREIEDMV